MRVVIPFTPLRETKLGLCGLRAATKAFGDAVGARFVDVSGSDSDYFELLRALWGDGETFIIVEHDVVPPPELIDTMWSCPSDHCAHATWCMWTVKYGAGLIKRWPRLFEEMWIGFKPEGGVV